MIAWPTPLEIFEELRFAAELLAAELLFALPFAKKKAGWLMRCAVGFALLLGAAQLYFLWPKGTLEDGLPGLDMCAYHVMWYSGIIVLSLAWLKMCFNVGLCDLIFLGIMGYAAQHIEYALCNELLAMALFPKLPENLPLYTAVCIVTCAACYALIWRCFARPLRGQQGEVFRGSKRIFALFTVMLVVLVGACFAEQHLFRFTQAYFSGVIVLLDVLVCLLILMIFSSAGRNSRLYQTQTMLTQMLAERQRQYEMSRDTIAVINQKCHDLRHQVQALRQMSAPEQAAFLDDIEDSVRRYDAMFATGNEALDTLLTEKQYACQKEDIQLTCVADGRLLAMLSAPDLYALLGNALENAIECVRKYPPEKRMISVQIAGHERFALIRVTNYFEGALNMEDGLPRTTKDDARYHGFGMRGMRMVAQKYGGTMSAGQDGSAFIVSVLIPAGERGKTGE